MCTNKNENKRRFAQVCTTHNHKQPHEIQNKKRNNRICAMKSDTREPSKLYREFRQLTFDAVQQQRDHGAEIFTELQIRLPDRPGKKGKSGHRSKSVGYHHLSPHNELVHLPYIAVATNTRTDKSGFLQE